MSQVSCGITDEPIDAGALLAKCTTTRDGAALLFVGVVRDQNDGREVDHLEYSAFAEMALRVLDEIAREAAARWETGRIAAVHRVGRLELGEVSVAIAVASPHRDAAYQASRYIIEELKRRVPIWKKEGYVKGAAEWLPGFPPPGAAAAVSDLIHPPPSRRGGLDAQEDPAPIHPKQGEPEDQQGGCP